MANEEKLSNIKKVAEAHWKWLETWLHIVYVDTFVHGYKHRLDEELERRAK
jgi:hypothetical protein